MILRRHKRTACWALSLTALAAASFIEVDDRVGGTCQFRPMVRSELRASVTGFIAEVRCDEGDSVMRKLAARQQPKTQRQLTPPPRRQLFGAPPRLPVVVRADRRPPRGSCRR